MPVLSQLNTLTVRDIVTRALGKLGIGAEGETLSSAAIEDGRTELNAMLDAWNAERLTIYTVNREVFPLVPNQQTYSVGPGGDFDTVRPTKLEYCLWQNTLVTPVVEYPMDVLDDDDWAAIRIKSFASQFPTKVWYDPTFPLGTLNVWPVPQVATSLVLGTWQQLSRFGSSNDPFSLPPAYEQAIVNHLAIQLAPAYGKEASATVVQTAKLAKANLKRLNAPNITMRCDDAVLGNGGVYDIRIGDYRR